MGFSGWDFIVIINLIIIIIICFTTSLTLEQPSRAPFASMVCAHFWLPGLTPLCTSI